VPYYLNEATGWGLDSSELKSQLAAARANGVAVRGLVVINPGNPTGQTLSEANMREVVAICAEEKLVLIADEVYQENIWRPDRPFVSFRKVRAALRLGT
jgi:alanine transaminase